MTEVRTTAGLVRGVGQAGLEVFRGIPFAEPPVGALRFAAPQPVRGWDGVREAVAYGPPPPQPGVFGMDALAGETPGEDWLTVNVFTPGIGAELPVMVWIQGGAYTIGMASLPEFDGARLAGEGGVVVVTFNYRVGFEGFGQLEGAPGNRGLLDQLAALEWVRDNIRAFGGNPDRVTIFGQSAGGGSVAALLAMPRARGLFRRAIAQSVQGTFFSPELAADIAAVCAAELGLRPTVAGLSTVDPARLASVGDTVIAKIGQWADRWGPAAHKLIPFAPVVDGDLLPVTPWQALAEGAGRDVELIAGHVRHEDRLLALVHGLLGQVTEEQAADALTQFAPGPDGPARYREHYPQAGPDELYDLVNSDWLFRMPSLRLAHAQAVGGGRAHLYELTWPAPGMDGLLGACHGLDVPLVFGTLTQGQPAMLLGGELSEAEPLSARMRAAWTAFATHGDPGWPAYDPEQRLTQVFDIEPIVTAYPEDASRLIWQHHTFAPLPLLAREPGR
ncbi:carboxylesterase family protein [Crossiella sp. SN42]|uniref:carboxylesterase/lipase family protein n=1 Tax=Crossiella sp. SN42 TaxID=2944808 RepID=UPI00207C7793|nr:carboxylesterase family protein [Crossiella sp. SN42]MCO1574710.1 carboxylesterase family protein [Crossiella sp. SN42]